MLRRCAPRDDRCRGGRASLRSPRNDDHQGAGFVGAARRGRPWCLWHNGPEVRTLLTATTPEFWIKLAEAVRRPESLAALDDAAFAARVDLLRDHAALPMALYELRQSDRWREVPVAQRDVLAREELRYKAASAVWRLEFEGILDLWAGEGLTPCLLKGAHAALAFYPAPHLRPMSDVDVLFTDLREAERAFEILISMGYEKTAMELGGDSWAMHHHLTALVNPSSNFTVEVHGSMIYPPKDTRAAALSCLWEEMAEVDVDGRKARGLCAEAFVVITFAHALVAHGAEPPKFQAIVDVAQVLKVVGADFRWDKLRDLALASGFAGVVSQGLAWTEDLLGGAAPAGFFEGLGGTPGEAGPGPGLTGDDYTNAMFIQAVLHGASLGAKASIVAHMLFPARAWMRERYPLKHRWPAWALYPYRWAGQARKVARVVRAKGAL